MSYGSATRTSIISPQSASLPHIRRPWQFALEWLTEITQYYERSSQYRELLELDDRLLADIGLSRYQIGAEALKSSRTLLTMWHVHR
jgi:uncharacterized protein YjiS (DUF1127 family)